MKQNSQNHHIHHYHRHMSISYPVSLRQRVYTLVVIPLLLLTAAFFVITKLGAQQIPQVINLRWGFVFAALIVTFTRLLLAYVLALALAIPLALLIEHSPHAEKIFLPFFDVMQSVPVLAFFPVVIIFFIHYNLYNSAAIFILLITMMWSIVFNIVGGLRVIPQDIKDASKIFHITGWQYIRKVLLPAVFPYIVTGSLLAWASGWNIIIVAEVLHTYIPGGSSGQDLFGIGSLLVAASADGQQHAFFMTLIVLVIFVALLNLFVWQKLLRYAEKYKFD
jgi:NitT/TauT family transport system permease protein